MSFNEENQVVGATIKAKWLHLIVINRGERVFIKADNIEADVKSRLQVWRLSFMECQFITETLRQKNVRLSRGDISAQNFSAVLEVLPPMKKKYKKEPKKRR